MDRLPATAAHRPRRRPPPATPAPGRVAAVPPPRPRGPRAAIIAAAAVTAAVLLGAAFPLPPLVDAATGRPPEGVALVRPAGHVAVAPLSDLLDALSGLAVRQHQAVLVTALGLWVAWRTSRRRARRTLGGRAAAEAAAFCVFLGGLAALYALAALLPRPMARLAVADPEVVVVDFHSHTEHSHDGLPGHGAEDNRAWHRAAGFDAAYVSDHWHWEGWVEGALRNPARAGGGTLLLPAIEVRNLGPNVNALGEPSRYRPALVGRSITPDRLNALARRAAGPPPTLILTLPAELDSMRARTPANPAGYVALEVNDASPLGLEYSRVLRGRVLRLADSLDLALVSASNNHGWGRAALAWTLLELPGWQRLDAAGLGRAIELRLHRLGREATVVVERTAAPYPYSAVAFVLAVPSVLWTVARTLQAHARLAWIAWAWLLAALALILAPPRLAPARRADSAQRRRGPGDPLHDAR